MFMCEKWLAVEEQDGKVEREFMALDATLHYGMVNDILWSVPYSKFHIACST